MEHVKYFNSLYLYQVTILSLQDYIVQYCKTSFKSQNGCAHACHDGLFCSGIMVERFIFFQIWMVQIQGVKKIIIILTK